MMRMWKLAPGLIAGCAILVGSTALAQMGPGPGEDTGMKGMKRGSGAASEGVEGKNVESQKHLSEVDLYLKAAMNTTKVLFGGTKLQPGKLDTVIRKEDVASIDKSIESALTHISHVKSLPEARISDTRSLDELQGDLKQARITVMQLRKNIGTADNSEISSMSSQLFAQLKAADEDFDKLASQVKLTRVDQITVPEKQPVGGKVKPLDEKPKGDTGVKGEGEMPSPGGTAPSTPKPEGGTNY